MDDKKINFLESLVKVAQSMPQKKQTVAIRNSGSILDKVELFTNKREINELKVKVKSEPAIRQERVDMIREAIRNETYVIQNELVARSILKSHLLDELLR